MELNITEIVLAILQKYGLVGVSIAMCVYYIRGLEKKIDRLINLNNKTFGVMLALVDGNKRNSFSQEADDA